MFESKDSKLMAYVLELSSFSLNELSSSNKISKDFGNVIKQFTLLTSIEFLLSRITFNEFSSLTSIELGTLIFPLRFGI